MNDQAREALGRVITAYGPSICQTPRSCELFVRQECGDFPQESRALVEALRQGVATELLGYQPDQPWPPLANELRKRLRSRTGLGEAEGAWAIDTWARVLGRHPEAWEEAPTVLAVPQGAVGGTVSKSTLRHAMTAIVALGGGLGGGLGSASVPAVLLATAASYKMPVLSNAMGHGPKMNVWLIVAVALLLCGAIGGFGGALGGALGWRYGKGDRAPWTAFSAAFGTAFTSSALAGYFFGIPGWLFFSFLAAFGAATTVARRGGYDR